MRELYRYYVPDGNYSQPLVSPLQAADLSGLPAALILSAEHDVLRDEAEAYAARLQAAGCGATYSRDCYVLHAEWGK
jgi:acetyl esterase